MNSSSSLRAADFLRDAAGPELIERLEHLDRVRRAPRKVAAHGAPRLPEPSDHVDADVALAGGGLWSILAPLLARRGLRVVVFDRARAGASHREWNASGPELEALVRIGLVDRKTLAALTVATYDHGTCRFAGRRGYPVTGVLDHAIDAGPLLAHARRLGDALGVTYLDGHEVRAHAAGTSLVRIRADRGGQDVELTARVLVDARGASSPYATADLVCPTVGGVLGGLREGDGIDEVNPRVGEILVTADGIADGRQHIWEAFPGRPGETTVYLFYYAETGEETSLTELYARFFEELGRYKSGEAKLLRPTFGYIPGWSRLTPAPQAPHERVVLVGDAAARHSPLTYCGFGATLRSLERASDVIASGVDGSSLAGALAVDDSPIHALTGALAHIMASRAFHGDEMNALLDASFRTLHELGNGPYARLLRDEMHPAEFVEFLRRTARRYPAVWGQVMRGLGVRTASRWGFGLARTLLSAHA